MSTFIDGIGQCQVLDKSGELVDLKGHDISSLDKTGTFTWEHQAASPATLVGKILKAKKIYSKDDCENDREIYYWNKCKTPYLYVMGELLDDYTASAKECAGQMKYSRDKPGQNPLLGFSIEGSEIPNTRKGVVITRSIGRKITLTQSPCNSMCVAEIFDAPEQKSQIADDFESIFKSTEEAITLFKSGEGSKMYDEFLAKKEAQPPSIGGNPPKSPYAEYDAVGIREGTTKGGTKVHSHGHIAPYKFNPAEHQTTGEHHEHATVVAQNPKLGDNKGHRATANAHATQAGGIKNDRAALSLNDKDKIAQEQGKQQVMKAEKTFGQHAKDKGHKIGETGTGKDVHSHGRVGEYGFNSGEHKEASELHRKAAVSAGNPKLADNHIERMRLHNQAAITAGLKENRAATAQKAIRTKAMESATKQMKKTEPCELHKGPTRDKSEPSGKLKKAITAGSYNAAPSTLVDGAAYQKESRPTKQNWNKRAKDDYETWPHREKFEKFMQARMPHLAMGEIKALGRVLALKKNIEGENALGELVSLEKAIVPKGPQEVNGVKITKTPSMKSGSGRRSKPTTTWDVNGKKYFSHPEYIKNSAGGLTAAHKLYEVGEGKRVPSDVNHLTMKEDHGHTDLGHFKDHSEIVGHLVDKHKEKGLEKSEKSPNPPTFEEHPRYKLPKKVKDAALAAHKKNPGAIRSITTEDNTPGGEHSGEPHQGGYWLHLNGHTVDNPGQHTYHSDNHEGLLRDIKNIEPCNCGAEGCKSE